MSQASIQRPPPSTPPQMGPLLPVTPQRPTISHHQGHEDHQDHHHRLSSASSTLSHFSYPSSPTGHHRKQSSSLCSPRSSAVSAIGHGRPSATVVKRDLPQDLSPTVAVPLTASATNASGTRFDASYTDAVRTATIPSTLHHLADSTPSLSPPGLDSSTLVSVFDSTISSAADESLAFSRFPSFRCDRHVGKLKIHSSPGAVQDGHPFFEDFGAPRESTPRKTPNLSIPSARICSGDGPMNLPLGPIEELVSDSSGPLSGSGPEPISNWQSQSGNSRASASEEEESSLKELRRQLQAADGENARLRDKCDRLATEVASLKDDVRRLTATHSSPGGALGLQSPMLASVNGHGTFTSRSPAMSVAPGHRSLCQEWSPNDIRSSPASPSISYVGRSLINSIQAQSQAGMDGRLSGQYPDCRTSPSASVVEEGLSRASSASQEPLSATLPASMLHHHSSTGSLSPLTMDVFPATVAVQGAATGYTPPWLPRSFAGHVADRSPLSQASPVLLQRRAGAVSPVLPLRPRQGGTPNLGHAVNGITGPSRLAGMDNLTSPDLLISRALAGRSQEASIILQQQLKTGNQEKQASIIRAMTPHLLPLAEDKHGNFLVQRAIGFDVKVAWSLTGSFVRLALSQYGCHVVQRVLDEEEPLRMQVVEELLADSLLDTMTSRNSVHVWAKALESKWTSDNFRRKLFSVINHQMKGRWADTAMQETGSIVVQNIFESATEGNDKQGCICEILERLADCAANQWGVWVVQHIIEHGEEGSRKAVFERLLSKASALSTSQFGQKAVMTALKSQDPVFITGYLDQLCESDVNGSQAASGRRSMLVEIACTPQGLQIMTQLLTTVSREDRERIIKTVRKSSVFLKGSKTGLKVHQMCERARAFTGY